MPSTYSQVLLHIVFATKHRTPWITTDFAPRLYAYLGGVLRNHDCTLLVAGGMPDHVHLLVDWSPAHAIADVLRDAKASSSAWAKRELHEPDFAWQEGYGVFSVSRSQREVVERYLQNQRQHHSSRSSADELRALLKAHAVAFDDRFFE